MNGGDAWRVLRRTERKQEISRGKATATGYDTIPSTVYRHGNVVARIAAIIDEE